MLPELRSWLQSFPERMLRLKNPSSTTLMSSDCSPYENALAKPSFFAKQASAWLPKLSNPLLQRLRRHSVGHDVCKFISCSRCSGSFRDTTAIDRNFAFGDPELDRK